MSPFCFHGQAGCVSDGGMKSTSDVWICGVGPTRTVIGVLWLVVSPSALLWPCDPMTWSLVGHSRHKESSEALRAGGGRLAAPCRFEECV